MSSPVAPESAHSSLHPAQSSQPIEGTQSISLLSNVLSNLSVQLDYELARYRYATKGSGKPRRSTAPQWPLPPRPQSLQLFQNTGSTPVPRDHQTVVTPPPVPQNPRLQSESPVEVTNVAETTSHPVEGSVAEVAALRSALVRQSEDPESTYLASSEALLESLGNAAYPEASPAAPPPSETVGWAKYFNTPLGLGAFLLLLVASAGFGFVLVNPMAVQHLVEQTPLARLWPSTDGEESAIAEDPSSDASDMVATSTHTPLNPLSPNLAEKEFTNLDLYRLSALPPTPGQRETEVEANRRDRAQTAQTVEEDDDQQDEKTIPAAQAPAGIPRRTTSIPQREVITQPIPPSSSAPSVVPSRSSQPSTSASSAPSAPTSSPTTEANPAPARRTQPTEATAPTQESAVAAPASASYYVVSDYTGDPSLETARGVVPDAYLNNNFDVGARIQLGAFASEASANALIEELQAQGIDASLHTVSDE